MKITSAADFLNIRLYCLPVSLHFLIPILHKDVWVNYSRNGFEIQHGSLSELECRVALQNVRKWMSQNAQLQRILYVYIVSSFQISAGQSLLDIALPETCISQQGKMVS